MNINRKTMVGFIIGGFLGLAVGLFAGYKVGVVFGFKKVGGKAVDITKKIIDKI